MSDNVNINVTENIDQVNIVASEVVEVIDLNLYATTEDVSINVTEEIIQVNINKVTNTGNQTLAETLAFGNITDGTDIAISDGDEITFDNGSRIRKGLTDSGNGGAKGVALVCSLDYELKWEAGRQYVMQQDGFTIREVSHNFTIVPTATDDDTKGFVIGSRWILDNGDVYECTDATEDDAVWVLTTIDLSGYVPYTGANQNVNLGEFEIKAGQFTLDTSPTGTAAVGTTRWNNTLGSSETTLKGGSVILKNGVDLVARVVNKVTPNTTLTKANYAAVRVSGAQGQRLAVAYAQANNDLNSADTIGLVCETIPTNQEGFIITVGQLEGINTTGNLQGENWNDGDVIYLSPTVAGKLTNIKPTAPQHIVIIGYVEYAHANHGKLYVKIMNGWELEELHNVEISGLTNNDFLYYDSGTSLWRNRQITPSFVLGTGTTSQYLRGDNTWVNLPVQNLATTGPVAITITATGVANLQNLSGHSFIINESVMPVGGLIQINGYVDRTAGSGAGNLAYDINGTKRYINTPSGSQYQYQFSFYRESATILRMMGGTSVAPYQGSFGSANAISASVTLTAGGNITFQLQGWGTALNDVHTYRFFKANLIR